MSGPPTFDFQHFSYCALPIVFFSVANKYVFRHLGFERDKNTKQEFAEAELRKGVAAPPLSTREEHLVGLSGWGTWAQRPGQGDEPTHCAEAFVESTRQPVALAQ